MLILIDMRILISACAALLACSLAGRAELIDHHQHLFSPAAAAHASLDSKGITAKDLIALLDKGGISRAVILSVAYTFSNPNKKQFEDEYERVKTENDWTSGQVAQYPGRLVGFCSVNPLKAYALQEIARCARDPNLSTGLKLHFGNSDVVLENPEHMARVRRVFRAANSNRMALVIHARSTINLNRPYGAAQARLLIEELLPEAPDVTVQIAHLAGSGGYDDPGMDEALTVYIDHIRNKDPRMRNVYFDVSGVVGLGSWNANKASRVVERMRQLGISRLLYGSDAAVPGNLPDERLQKWRELPLTNDEFRLIESNSAPYLLRKPPQQ